MVVLNVREVRDGKGAPVPAFDPRKPSIARVYDYLVGGKDNFGPDRDLAERLLAISPSVGLMFRENREFLSRAVTWVAGQGVAQFIDLGSGLPSEPNTQGTAQSVLPGARVVYVDNDPVVVSHLRVEAHRDPTVMALAMDVDDVDGVLKAAAGHVDLTRPVCLLMGALLHFYEAPAGRDLVARYASALAPGSYVALTVGQATPGAETDRMVGLYSSGPHPVRIHSLEDFLAFFGELELLPPGAADARVWWPGWERVPQPAPRATWTIAGLARVPA
jgi:hypothetical protein